MTAVAAMNGTKLLVQLGDGQSAETFAHDCMINTERGIAFSADTNRVVLPDCDSPAAPAWSEVIKDGLAATINGAGVLHLTTISTWDAWFRGDISKNIRVNLNETGGGYWEGAAKLTGWEINGTRNDNATVSVTIESDGVMTWTPSP